MSIREVIEVGHLIQACNGDEEKLSGLAVLISMAAYAMGHMGRVGMTGINADGIDSTLPQINEQLQTWAAAIEEIHRQIQRRGAH